ncbi:MAG: DNA translocase FtsK [Ardenticatenaceae bacterium]|nr:DNA translocase FtsK [Ardenticatenaceae bacterium]
MAKKKSDTPPPSPPTWDELLINRLYPWRFELIGFGLFLFAMLTLMALLGLTQSVWLNAWQSLLWETFGWGNYPLFLSIAAAGIHFGLHRMERPYHIHTSQIIGGELILLTALPLSYQYTNATLADAHLGRGGGLVGWALAAPLLDLLGPVITTVLYGSVLLWGLALLLRVQWQDVWQGLEQISLALQQLAQKIAPPEETIVAFGSADVAGTAVPVPQITLDDDDPLDETEAEEDEDELLIIDDSAPDGRTRTRRRSRKLPPVQLLEEGGSTNLSPEEIDEKKQIIEQTLADFGLPATVTEIRRGPAVTQFGVEPGYVERPGPDGQLKQQKVRVSQIAALQRDLAMALAVQRLRIEAPVPGRGVVGIEVPNDEISMVRMRSVVEADSYHKLKSPLAVALGRNVSGAPIAIDLAKMPHLLVAGTTGSGKSVLINAMISCLVFNNTPDKLQLIMLDPKKVELIRFNGLPHLIGKVETEADRAVGVLRWLTAEMDRRYEMFAQVGARNLNSYNRKIAGKKDVKQMPYMGVFIDELSDLILTYPGDVERTLCRLAQMARATGIHLVVATQRPSTDVITGLIKANFPARISFSVASGTDSRVILDSVGAEHLLGKGDMLFLSPEAGEPARIQGVWLSDPEIEAIVKFWQQALPDFQPGDPPWENLIARYAHLDKTDTLLEAAIEIVKKNDNVSTSMLQRRLRLGYPRAARIMQHLYEMGLVEDPQEGGKTRQSLVDEDADDPLGDYLSEQE